MKWHFTLRRTLNGVESIKGSGRVNPFVVSILIWMIEVGLNHMAEELNESIGVLSQ